MRSWVLRVLLAVAGAAEDARGNNERHEIHERKEIGSLAADLRGFSRIFEGIEWEKDQLSGLRQAADKVIDTSSFNIHQLRKYIQVLCGPKEEEEQKLQVEIISFSYAKGLPFQADLIVDVRFLPNPHYDPKLKDRDGRDSEVQEYIRNDPKPTEILEKFLHLIEDMISFYEKEDRTYLVLAVGCTGGRHRSVAVVCRIEERLRSLGYSPKVFHRDIRSEQESTRFQLIR